jgi:hypothetical protein
MARPGIFVLGGLALLVGCGDDSPGAVFDMNNPALCMRANENADYELFDTDAADFVELDTEFETNETSDGIFVLTDTFTREEYTYKACADAEVSTPDSQPEETEDTLVDDSTTTQAVDTTADVPTTQANRTSTTVRSNATSTSAPRSTSTMAPYGGTTTTSYVPQGPPSGTWIRNDSRCRWLGASTCGVYSGGNGQWEEAGPSGGPGSTFTPIAGTSGQIAYNLLSGNSILSCDWNGSGECGFYFTGTPGTLTMGPVG